MHFNIYTDGSCIDHGQDTAKGGWAYIVKDQGGNTVTEQFGKLRAGRQTHNRAELEAMLQALIWVDSQKEGSYTLYSDSLTIVDGITGKAVRNANRDIWVRVEELCAKNVGRIDVLSVKAHVNDSDNIHEQMNCIVDKLAKQGALTLLLAPIKI